MDLQKDATVVLAGKKYVVEQVPMARIKRLGTVVADAIQSVDADVSTPDGVQAVLERLLDAPHALLSVFIVDLPREIFHDETHGVTLPEVETAVKTAFELNRVDVLKNVFSRLGTMLQASTLTRMS
ncbi:MAG: hypothetical protein K6T78_12240 [Alicyclobacillus sp.]|nr:hypothetical protein [Alicyclobacillus sp.]